MSATATTNTISTVSSNTTVVEHTYSSAFLLDKSKLSRILNIIINKYRALDIPYILGIEVTLENGKRVTLNSLDELFALDNAIRNLISSLTINVNSLVDDNQIQPLLVTIDYAKGRDENISAKVVSVDSATALQLFAEIEEQIERTFLKDWVYSRTRTTSLGGSSSTSLPLPLFLAAIGASVLIASLLELFRPGNYQSQSAIAKTLIEKYGGATSQEEKINFLFESSMEQLRSKTSLDVGSIDFSHYLNLQTLFVVLPILIVIITSVYTVARCYPYANFLWGDYEEHYLKLVSKRNTLWNIIVGSIIFGILGNLFIVGLSSYINFGQ